MSLPLSHPPLPSLRLSLWFLTGTPTSEPAWGSGSLGDRPPKIEPVSRGAAEGDRQRRKGAPIGTAKSMFPSDR